MSVAQAWIGPAPGRTQTAAILMVGVAGVMIAGLQPLLLGTLAQEGKVSAAQLGQAATAELLTMGAAAGLAGAFVKSERLRTIGVGAALLLALFDAATPFVQGAGVTLVRAAAGAPSGVLMWITIAMIARAPTPERWAGVYLTVQTLAQFLLATFLTAAIVPTHGSAGGFFALALFCVATAMAALLLPSRYAPLKRSESGGGLPSARGWTALVSAFLYLAFTIGVWVYAEPISRQAGHAPHIAGVAVSISLAAQVAGGLAATLLAGRIRWFVAVFACAGFNVALLAGFYALPAEAAFLALSGAFGFIWLFSTPFFVPMVIEADPTRRAAMLMGGAQLLGGSFGPLFASALVTDADVRGAILFGGGCLVLSIAIAVWLRMTRLRVAAAAA